MDHSEQAEISKEGWMRTTMSKMSRANKWADRFFILRGPVLFFYLKATDSVSDSSFHSVSTDAIVGLSVFPY